MSDLNSWEDDPAAQDDNLSRQAQQMNLNNNAPQQGGGFRPGAAANTFQPGAQSFQPGQNFPQYGGAAAGGYDQSGYQNYYNQQGGQNYGYNQYGAQQQPGYNQYQGGYNQNYNQQGGFNQGGYCEYSSGAVYLQRRAFYTKNFQFLSFYTDSNYRHS